MNGANHASLRGTVKIHESNLGGHGVPNRLGKISTTVNQAFKVLAAVVQKLWALGELLNDGRDTQQNINLSLLSRLYNGGGGRKTARCRKDDGSADWNGNKKGICQPRSL